MSNKTSGDVQNPYDEKWILYRYVHVTGPITKSEIILDADRKKFD